jgi:hypothetical protein
VTAWGLAALVVALDAGAARGPGAVTASDTASVAPPIEVSASASASAVAFGEVVELVVVVEHPSGITVNLPASLELGAFEELARRQRQTTLGPGRVRLEYVLSLAAYGLGAEQIPPLPVTAVIAGSALAVPTAPISVTIASLVEYGEPTPRPPAAPVSVMRRSRWPLWVAAAGGLLGVLVLTGVALRRSTARRRAEGRGALATAPRPAPHDEALARLLRLEASGALDADDLKPAYFEMSEILRDYVGRRFGFPGIDFTTAEVSAELARREAATAFAPRVSAWLETADFVKFAAYPASADEARQALYQARQFVNESMPREQAGEGRGG